MNFWINKSLRNNPTYLVFIFILLFWQLCSNFKIPGFNIHLLPSPIEIFYSFLELLQTEKSFFNDLLISTYRVFLGFISAAIVGVLLGVSIVQSKKCNKIILPIIDIIRPIPNIVWLPIVIVLFSSMWLSILAIPFLGALPPIVLSTHAGAMTMSEHLLSKMKIHNINGWTYIKNVLIPWSWPYIRNGLNIGISNAWLGVVLSEMTAGRNGLGYFTWISFQANNYDHMMIGAITIGILGFASSNLFLNFSKKIYHGESRAKFN